jgi:hypothetical protein
MAGKSEGLTLSFFDDMFSMMARLPRVLVPPIGGGYATDPGKCREPPGALVRDGKDDAPPRASRSSELAPFADSIGSAVIS